MKKKSDDMKFAFLVHPRDLEDVFKKYSILRYLPESLVKFVFLKIWPPVIVSKITGLISKKTGMKINGCIVSIPLTAHQMMEHRELARQEILKAIKLAQSKGVKIVGLGALTSSLTGGGTWLLDKTDVKITTGHAYTAYNVSKNIFELEKILTINKKDAVIGIVGAAGSIGSTSAKILARGGFNNLLLVDLEHKQHFFEELARDLTKLNPSVTIKTSHQINDVKIADIILAATNAPEALVKSEDLKTGAVVVNDAQPSDISPEVFDRDDVLVVEAGVVHTPGVKSNFDLGLKDKFDNFCCMAELLILASQEWQSNYVINRATLKEVDEVAEWGSDLGFQLGHFQNPKGLVSEKKIQRIRAIIQKRNGL